MRKTFIQTDRQTNRQTDGCWRGGAYTLAPLHRRGAITDQNRNTATSSSSNLLPLSGRRHDELEHGDDHRQTETGHQDVEYSGDVAQCKRTLRRPLQQQPASGITWRVAEYADIETQKVSWEERGKEGRDTPSRLRSMGTYISNTTSPNCASNRYCCWAYLWVMCGEVICWHWQ